MKTTINQQRIFPMEMNVLHTIKLNMFSYGNQKELRLKDIKRNKVRDLQS